MGGEPEPTAGLVARIAELEAALAAKTGLAEQTLQTALAAEQARRQQAETLRQASLSFSHTLDVDTIVGIVLDQLEQLVPYDAGAVALLDQDGYLTVHATRGELLWATVAGAQAVLDALLGTVLLQPLLDEHTSVVLSAAQGESSWLPLIEGASMGCWLGVPLVATEELLGLVMLGRTTPGELTDDQLRHAEALTARAALAIQTARLFAEVRVGRARLRALSERLIAVQEAERRHLARELHDEIGQRLTALGLLLELRPQLTEAEQEQQRHEAGQMVAGLITQIRTLSLELRPTLLDDLGLRPALRWLFDRYYERTGVTVTFKDAGLERRFPTAIETATYRIVQEALTNVARHSDAATAQVRVWTIPDALCVQIEDQGRGFDLTTPDIFSRGGLSGLRERVQLLDGKFVLESAPGQGTFIGVELPLLVDEVDAQGTGI